MFYGGFSIGSLRMSEKRDILEGYESNNAMNLTKRGRLMTEDFEKTLREKKKMLLSSNFPIFLKCFPSCHGRKQFVS